MTYLQDGTPHSKGVENEKQTLEIIKTYNSNVIDTALAGGTQKIEDGILIFGDKSEKKVSIKKKEGVDKGSFNWINTSLLDDVNIDIRNTKRIYEQGKNIGYKDENLKRTLQNNIKVELDNISSDQLRYLIETYIIDRYKDISLVINDVENKYVYICENISKFYENLIESKYEPEIVKNRKSQSKKIIFNRKDHSIDLGLRLRLHLNNGYTAWWGINPKNPTAVPVIKLQQDKISQLLEIINIKEIINYGNRDI